MQRKWPRKITLYRISKYFVTGIDVIRTENLQAAVEWLAGAVEGVTSAFLFIAYLKI